MKRIFLFLITNLAVLLVAGLILQLLGVEGILDQRGVGLDLRALLLFSAVFGMAGSFPPWRSPSGSPAAAWAPG